MAKGKSTVDTNFEKRLRELKQHAADEATSRDKGEGSKWDRPETWAGDPFDYEALHTPFDREKANQDYVSAVKDASSPGTIGDLVATTGMVDTLATMERSFRVRHTLRRPRATAHVLARRKGHGNDRGPVTQLTLEYIRAVIAGAKQ